MTRLTTKRVGGSFDLIFPKGGSVTNGIYVGGIRAMGLLMPTAWSTAELTFQVSADGESWLDLHDGSTGDEYSLTVDKDKALTLDPAIFSPWTYLRLRSGTASLGVPQDGTDKASAVIDFGEDRTLTLTSGVTGTPSEGLLFVVNSTEGADVSVTNEDNIIVIGLSSSDVNTAANIQGKLRALGEVTWGEGDDAVSVDLSGITVTASSEYAASPPGGTASTLDLPLGFGGKWLYFDRVALGSVGNSLDIMVFANEEEDALSVTNPSGNAIVIRLAPTTSTLNTPSLIEAAIQSLGTVGDDLIDVSSMTVTGNAAYVESSLDATEANLTVALDETKELTFASNQGGVMGNGVSVSIAVNQDEVDSDVLDVTLSGGDIQILLADTTPAKNAASAIQTLVQGLPMMGDFDFSLMTVTGNAAYNASPPVALGTGVTISQAPLSGGSDALTSPSAGGLMVGGTDATESRSFSLDGGKDTTIRLLLRG